jgi:hypothetical protein
MPESRLQVVDLKVGAISLNHGTHISRFRLLATFAISRLQSFVSNIKGLRMKRPSTAENSDGMKFRHGNHSR